jgi:alpha-1,3-glucosyltransferase
MFKVGPRHSETTAGFAYLMMAIGLLLRWAVALHSYSGEAQPPMFGDYEAQRHWQEVTLNLPVSEWYRNTSSNDLNYWGLDYPPLSAYHSLVLGYVARNVNPSFVELLSSRGFESLHHKLFMRTSSLLTDALLLVPALVTCLRNHRHSSLALALIYPVLILVDHGHFQYNSVSLGLTAWAIIALRRQHAALAASLFCLALNYKQIALYHALPFFCFMLGLCLKQASWSLFVRKLSGIVASVLLTFCIVWLPFLTSVENTLQVLHRVFPVARGLYEDKVANFWCTLSVLVKPQHYLTPGFMALLCSVMTLLSVLPSCVDLLKRPGQRRFELSLLNCSLGFFLFSFHVHEKSILFPALPALLLLPIQPHAVVSFLWISSYSLLQLAFKDGLALVWLALQLLFLGAAHTLVIQPRSSLLKFTMTTSLVCSAVLTLAYVLLTPPVRYPDLFPLLLAVFCCVHFLGFLFYFTRLQLSLPTEKNTLAE